MSDDEMLVRRLTPRECERLQGFPDDWTFVPVPRIKHKKWCEFVGKIIPKCVCGSKVTYNLAKDGPRYKACGNSMAVPVMRWIGERIALIELLGEHDTAA